MYNCASSHQLIHTHTHVTQMSNDRLSPLAGRGRAAAPQATMLLLERQKKRQGQTDNAASVAANALLFTLP